MTWHRNRPSENTMFDAPPSRPILGTFGILRALMVYIQGEAHPLFRAEQRHHEHPRLRPGNLLSWLWLVVFLALPALYVLQSQLGLSFASYRDEAMAIFLVLGSGLLSLCWTVPFTVLAGQSLARERVARTWDVLLATPYPPDVILLAKAAAGIHRLWWLVVGSAILASLAGIVAVAPLLLGQAVAGAGILPLALIGVAVVAIVVEHQQEMALSLLIGIFIALKVESRRTLALLGLFSGCLVRIVGILVVFILLPSGAIMTSESLRPLLELTASQNPALLNAALLTLYGSLAGSATWLAVTPGLLPLLALGGLLTGRELLIRALFTSARSALQGP